MKDFINIKENKITININNDEYNKIYKIINDVKKFYKSDLKRIKTIKHYNVNDMYVRTMTVRKIIETVVGYYDEIKKYKVDIFLVGSYARCTCKNNSDIDIQFAYPFRYRYQMLKYKEIIEYIISEVLDISKSKIHSAISEKMNLKYAIYIKKHMSNSDLFIELKSPNNKIGYMYKSNVKKRIYLTYNCDNSIKKIFKYMRNEIRCQNREWAHVFYPINNKEKLYRLYKSLYLYEKKHIAKNKLENRKESIINIIDEINEKLEITNMSKMKNFKHICQVEEFKLFNEYISFKRDSALINDHDWFVIDYIGNQEYLKNDLIFNNIMEYMFILFSIVLSLGENYSVHVDDDIDRNTVNLILKKINTINSMIGDSIYER